MTAGASTPPATVDEMVAAAERDGVEFVLFMFVDMHGKPCAKLVPTPALADIAVAGAGFAGFAA
jgi:glutamine synthetase